MTSTDRSLTDRYVAATVARLPQDQRADVEAQLREAIGDDLDAHLESGLSDVEAERAVLTQFGDPERLAATYADRRLYLIGPDMYLPWKRLTVMLAWIVLPIVAVLIPLGGWLDGDSVGSIIGTTIGGTTMVGVQLIFWVTVVFAAMERGQVKARDVTEEWSVDRLAAAVEPRIAWADTIGAASTIVITFVLLVWQQWWPWAHTTAGDGLPIINPDLWSFTLPALIIVMAIDLVCVIARQLRGHWTRRDWWLNLALNGASVALVAIPVASGQWLNRALFHDIGWPDAATTVTLEQVEWATVAIVIAVAIVDVVTSYRKMRRAQ